MRKNVKIIHNNETYYVNPNTGEVMDYDGKTVYIQTLEERKRTKEYFKKQKEKEKKAQQINEQYKEYGNFVWSVYNINQQLFANIKPSNITRLMYISTYLNYKGYLMYNQRTVMTKKNMSELLRLSDRGFIYFYKDMIDNNILQIQNNKIYINHDLFGKGSLPKNQIAKFVQNDKYITRLYIDGVRAFYDISTSRSHKTLSYLFQILPYVNREFNIVCFNPLEEDLDKVQCMSLGEFCNTIGYDYHNVKQLQKKLFDTTFTINGKITTAIGCVNTGLSNSDCKIFINPKVYYAGNQWDKVEVFKKF